MTKKIIQERFDEETVDRYMAKRNCPYCNSLKIKELGCSGDIHEQFTTLECNTCRKRWVEHWEVMDELEFMDIYPGIEADYEF